jgi:hypothetical protein
MKRANLLGWTFLWGWALFLAVALFVALTGVGVGQAGDKKDIIGAWYVDTLGAPFAPHAISFHADGIIDLTNPDAAEAQNSSSAGMGEWVATKQGIKGVFFEVNADKTTHQFTTLLRVTFTLTVTGNKFQGPATAEYFDRNRTLVNGPFPADLRGQRITVGGPIPDPIEP